MYGTCFCSIFNRKLTEISGLLESLTSDIGSLSDLSTAISLDLRQLERLPLGTDAMLSAGETARGVKSKQLRSSKLIEEIETSLSSLQASVGEDAATHVAARVRGV